MEPFAWLTCPDPKLSEALTYLAQNPGKQLRSRLTLACAELIAGSPVPEAIGVGEAIELLHTYSLVHDDLPAMDDDDLRRGQPTLHCAFDEATAILTGDGLQAAAFQRVADIESLTAEQRLSIIKIISIAVGFNGMVGGQALDLAAEQQAISVDALRAVHHLKTGALICAAAEAGAVCAKATSAERQALVRFAEAIGLAFQVTDDVLDVTGNSAHLGKTAGKDERAEKSTYVSTLGLSGAQQEAERLLIEATDALSAFGDRATPLRSLADAMVKRDT
ncbi:polyprenyl synthetase family protein [Luminiphilus sp.]|jgi:geranylgeranyl pyrophosphate synthase|nr:polyprenyl synthetase family protein [Luminiphilus sp.]